MKKIFVHIFFYMLHNYIWYSYPIWHVYQKIRSALSISVTSIDKTLCLKKTELKKRSKKYLYICGVVLVVAIISVGVAYLLSTNNMNDKLKSQVKEGVNELPNKEFMKQVVSNVTDVEYLDHVFSNISIMGIEKVQTEMDLLSRGKQ